MNDTPHPIITTKVKIQHRQGMLPILTTSRLQLREIQVEDISDDYVNWLNDPKITENLEIRFDPQSREAVTRFVESKLTDITNGMHFGVYDQEGQRLVGTVSLNRINPHHKFADISYVIGNAQVHNLGYATEAVHAVVHYALTQAGVVKIFAGYYQGHQGSANVLAKCGFTIEGCLKQKYVNAQGQRVDHILVGILADEYQQMRSDNNGSD